MSETDWAELDWDLLAKIREGFLGATQGVPDYWSGEHAVMSYHLTFGERIGWKWDAVLDELERVGWAPPPGVWWDWGCGSGIAVARVLRKWPGLATEVVLWDRSATARRFAAARLREEFPDLSVRLAAQGPTATDLAGAFVTLSHVWNELAEDQQAKLPPRLREATAVLWVEPGTKDAGQAISTIREKLRESFSLVAPCPHQSACGMLSPEVGGHWCHFHARPPTRAFTDGGWRAFSEILGVDLRRLSYAYLCADKRPVGERPTGLSRPTGYAVTRKYGVEWQDCAEEGVRKASLNARTAPALVKAMAKGKVGPWLKWSGPAEPPVESWP